MMQVVNQFRRIFSDDGAGDKDFGDQDRRLREAQQKLLEATTALTRVSEILRDLVMSKDEPRH